MTVSLTGNTVLPQLYYLYSALICDPLQKAYRVLEKHPQILSSRIAIIGGSFGSSIALKMAAYSQVIKVRCLFLSLVAFLELFIYLHIFQ